MKTTQFVLALLDAAGGQLQGRTLIQKVAYFTTLLSGVDPGLDFNAHFYGPYSGVLDSTITQLKNLGFVAEGSIGFGVTSEGFELKRYDYALTPDGRKLTASLRGTQEYQRVAAAFNKIRKAGDPDYFELSIAAKAYFVLDKGKKPMSNSEIRREAEKSFNWTIQPQYLEGAVKFLHQLNLTEDAKRGHAV